MNNLIVRCFIAVIFSGIALTFKCYGQAPVISYQTPNSYTQGKEIQQLKPTITVGKATSFAICPGLPDGFNFDEKTGIITGKPSSVSDEKYCISATNAAELGKPFQIEIIVKPSDSTPDSKNNSDVKTDCCKIKSDHCLRGGEWCLVFMPLMLFAVFIIFFLIFVNSSKAKVDFSLNQALSESSNLQITEINRRYEQLSIDQLIDLQKAAMMGGVAMTTTNFFPATLTKTDNYRSSISRIIAFLTSMLSIAVGLGLSCFFIYSYLKNGCIPDLSKLSGVLISMGIGVVPYAFNRISNMGSNNPTKP